MNPLKSPAAGFSIIEVLVTMGLIAVMALATMNVISAGMQRNSSTLLRQEASDMLALVAESMRGTAPTAACVTAFAQATARTLVLGGTATPALTQLNNGANTTTYLSAGAGVDFGSGNLRVVANGISLSVDTAANARIDTVNPASDIRYLGVLSVRFQSANVQSSTGPSELERSLFLELQVNPGTSQITACRFLAYKPNNFDSYFEGALAFYNPATNAQTYSPACLGPGNQLVITGSPPQVSCAALPANAP